jgi:molecular chaperone DnaK
MMDITVGIDLGTTNSALAYVNVRGIPEIVPNDLGSPITPSVICIKDGEIIVGEEAKELQAIGEPDVAAFFKQQMGVKNFSFYAGGREFSAVDLSALVLEKLKRDAEMALGQSIKNAVITVPAYFKNPQREDTIAAGEKAGLNVLQIINEPTAAAIAYGIRQTPNDQTLVVYDLGGGTFDVTVLEIADGEIRIKTSDGDNELGGKDWDYRVIEFIAAEFEREYSVDPLEDAESLSDLLVRVEETKRQLSARESAVVSITHEGRQGRYELTRAHFEQLTADLMERTISLTRKALADAEIEPQAVDGVLLVGGSTRMPMVKDFIVRTFGKPPLSGVNVDEAVALGAAIKASEWSAEQRESISTFAIGGALKSVDVTNHSLGMIAINSDASAYVNAIILPKNATLPCVESRPFKHRAKTLEVFLTQGETESPAEPVYLGKYVVTDIPPKTEVLDIEYSYDISGTVQVAARVGATEQQLPVTVEPLPPDVPDRFIVPPEQSQLMGHITVYLKAFLPMSI